MKKRKKHSRNWYMVMTSLWLTALLDVALVWDHFERKAIAAYYYGMDDAIYDLQFEQYALAGRIEELQSEYQLRIDGSACLTIVCTELTESIYTEVYPDMQKHGYTGILALSEKQLPDAADCITSEQFRRMTEDGWGICLLWDGETALEQWLPEMQHRLQARGLPMPQELYFERDTYTKTYDTLLAQYGIDTVVHHQEEGLPYVTTQLEEGVQHIGAMGWNQTGSSDRLARAAHSGGILVFTIGDPYVYHDSQFVKMLDKVDEYCTSSRVLVTDFSAASTHRLSAQQLGAAHRAELEEEIAKVQQQIAALDEEIQAVFDSYRNK